MALVVSNSGDETSRKSSSFRAENKKPWMLRDYLRDDLGSCSSNGFRSFPRRQCCAAVKNIIEKEVIRHRTSHSKPPMKCLSRSRTFSSALHRASNAIVNAVKYLPFRSTAIVGERKRVLLPRSFSKKLFKKSFWLKNNAGERKLIVKEDESDHDDDDEIERWISSGVVGCEKYRPLDLSNDTTVTNASTTSDGKSDTWSDISFSSSENDVVERRDKSPMKTVNDVSVTSAGEDSQVPAITKNTRCNGKHEQEQFSPVSVMDFPDNSEEGSSPITLSKTHLRGTKERLVKKLGKFESFLNVDLQPVNLESLFSTTKIDNLSREFSIQPCSSPTYIISSGSEEDGKDICSESEDEDEYESKLNEVEVKVERLLDTTRSNISSKTITKVDHELDNLVLTDFFRENIEVKDDHTLLKSANDWLNGHYDRLILGWEVKEKRQAYIRDMEEEGKWTKDTKLQKEDITIELGVEVLAQLIEELLVDIYCC